MLRDPIVDEIHRQREEHAREFNYDARAMFEDLKRREQSSERQIIRLEKSGDEPASGGSEAVDVA